MGERLASGEEVVGQRGERELVGAGVEALAAGLLRCDVRRRAPDHGQARGHVHRLAEAEVAQHRDHLLAGGGADGAEEHVGGLHVAVQHPALVQGGEALADLVDDRQRLRVAQPAELEPVRQRALVGVRHDEEGAFVVELTGVVDAHDVRRLHLAQEAALLDEALPDVEVPGPVVGQHLDGHRRVEVLVVGEPHGRERPGPDATAHRVTTETRGSGHVGIIVQG